ncbi:hypothetical protein PCANC_09210 [Puccinia coronata f. sp. avenae]|uniref:Uncharacterized protein n=1 Tax=Puccinia coronata f. sp. avenae TaxID=200324 RepID=A0A2N5SZC8_9BASI|nr:hypothetical protein PCANC_09210 [Puccinia coronata f. sp. avenae]
MPGNSSPGVSSTTLIFILVGIASLLLLMIITAVIYKQQGKKTPTHCKAEAPMVRSHPTARESDSHSHSAYQLPDFRRSSAPSISQAVFQVFRNCEEGPPPIPEVKAKQNVAKPQRPRWSRWFGRQPNEQSSFSVDSSFSSGTSPMTAFASSNNPHERLSLSSFPRPPSSNQSTMRIETPDIACAGRSGSLDAFRHTAGNLRSTPVFVFPGTNAPLNYPSFVQTSCASPPPVNGSTTGASLNPGSLDVDHYEEMKATHNRARIVSNSTSRQHRSMHVEISVLPSEVQASTPNNTPPSNTILSKSKVSRQPHIHSITEGHTEK